MKIRVEYDIVPRKRLEVEPGDFLDDTQESVTNALHEMAAELMEWSAHFNNDDLAELMDEVERLRAKQP